MTVLKDKNLNDGGNSLEILWSIDFVLRIGLDYFDCEMEAVFLIKVIAILL